MIQRIQSIYLFLATAITCCLFAVPYTAVGNAIMKFKVTACHISPMLPGMKDSTMLPLSIITACAAVICLISIFLYGNRTRQMKIVRLCTLLQVVVLIGMVAYAFGVKQPMPLGATIKPQFAMALPVVNIILLIMANRRIKADDDLVKSADRLR